MLGLAHAFGDNKEFVVFVDGNDTYLVGIAMLVLVVILLQRRLQYPRYQYTNIY